VFHPEIRKMYNLDSISFEFDDKIELHICHFIFHLHQLLDDFLEKKENIPWQSIYCNSAFILTFQCLNFKILRTSNQDILISFWMVLITHFDETLFNFYSNSQFDDSYYLFNQLFEEISDKDFLDNWEIQIIKIWKSICALDHISLKNEYTEIIQLKKMLKEDIPKQLREIILHFLPKWEEIMGKGKNYFEKSVYAKIAILKQNMLILENQEKINLIIESHIEIIQSFFHIGDYEHCLKQINIAQFVFEKYGYISELYILDLFRGMIFYYQGNLKNALEKFEFLIENHNKLNFTDFLTSILFLLQVSLQQRKEVSQKLEDNMNILESKFKDIEQQDQINFNDLLSSHISSIQKPEICQFFIDYFVEQETDLKNKFNLSDNMFEELLIDFTFLKKLYNQKYLSFFNSFAENYSKKPLAAIEFLSDFKFKMWLKNIKQKDRELANQNLENKILEWFEVPTHRIELMQYLKEQNISKNSTEILNLSYKNPSFLWKRLLSEVFK
jgi:hypothetical protein